MVPPLVTRADVPRAINHSPVYYPNPHTFEPRRFLNDPEFAQAKPFPAPDKSSPSFGWGRRICPGEHMATYSVFITIAKVCWAFKVRKFVDGNGKVEEPDTFAYTDGGFNIRPEPFRK
jgi:cytochrome P450